MRDTGPKTGHEDSSIGTKQRTAAAPARPVADRLATLNAAYADLLRGAERLERSNYDLAAYGQELAHDLSEGVATIAFFAEALETTLGPDLDAAARRELAGIRAGVKRTQSLISEALRTVERGLGSERRHPVSTNAVLRDALFNLRALREHADAKVTAEPLPPVSGDGSELIRLFQNLLANAIRFRDPDRPVRVRIGARQEGRRWRFEITDNGIGIDHEAVKSMLAESPRGSEAAAAHPGIGLRVCGRIVEAHGGRLRLESEPDPVGTTVSFDLPAVEVSGLRRSRDRDAP